MKLIEILSLILFIIWAIFYLYQIIYFMVGIGAEIRTRFITSKQPAPPLPEGIGKRRYAFTIAARNEEDVITQLIESLQQQTYPSELFDIFVIADNCDDNTADVARAAGAYVYERTNPEKRKKGYALSELFDHIKKDFGGYRAYDGYIIFDADNIADKNYLKEIDKEFCKGRRVITGYRNSKNFGTNWITSGYSIGFIREAQYLNRPRMILNASAAAPGTGYLISSEILEEKNGWHYHSLSEDYEFTSDLITEGEKIGYTCDAVYYDEQPETFKQSWTQRIRWTRGFFQVLFKYGKGLLKNMFKDKSMFLARYDILMFLAPSLILNLVTAALSIFTVVLYIVDAQTANSMTSDVIMSFVGGLVGFYVTNLFQGAVTVFTEWNKIRATKGRKIAAIFTYPLFMFTYIPISFVALLVRPQWNTIKHHTVESIEDFNKDNVQTVRDFTRVNITPPKDMIYSGEEVE